MLSGRKFHCSDGAGEVRRRTIINSSGLPGMSQSILPVFEERNPPRHIFMRVLYKTSSLMQACFDYGCERAMFG